MSAIDPNRSPSIESWRAGQGTGEPEPPKEHHDLIGGSSTDSASLPPRPLTAPKPQDFETLAKSLQDPKALEALLECKKALAADLTDATAIRNFEEIKTAKNDLNTNQSKAQRNRAIKNVIQGLVSGTLLVGMSSGFSVASIPAMLIASALLGAAGGGFSRYQNSSDRKNVIRLQNQINQQHTDVEMKDT